MFYKKLNNKSLCLRLGVCILHKCVKHCSYVYYVVGIMWYVDQMIRPTLVVTTWASWCSPGIFRSSPPAFT